jgi:hypothetical protein
MVGHRRDIAVHRHRDDLFLRLADQFAGRLIGDKATMVDDRDPVAQLLGLFEIWVVSTTVTPCSFSCRT